MPPEERSAETGEAAGTRETGGAVTDDSENTAGNGPEDRGDAAGIGGADQKTKTSDGATDSADTSTDATAPPDISADDTASSDTTATVSEPTTDGTVATADSDDGWWLFPFSLGATVLLLFQVVLSFAVVYVTTGASGVPGWLISGDAIVPAYVYLYAGLGGFGFVFTRVVHVDPTTERVVHWSLRVVGALPLAAGTHLLAVLLLPEGTGGSHVRILAGLAFLTGLFVDLSYRRLNALALRLLGSEEDSEDEERRKRGRETNRGNGLPSDTANDSATERPDTPRTTNGAGSGGTRASEVARADTTQSEDDSTGQENQPDAAQDT